MKQTENIKKGNPLGWENPKKLLWQFAVPSIISMLVGSLYNVVDQVFIGWKVGMLGNAATNVSYPLTNICLSISLMIGIGAASRFGLELGRRNPEAAEKSVGNALILTAVSSILYAILVEIFAVNILNAFGATAGVLPYAMTYTVITAAGFPLQIFGTVASNLIRADGSPRYSMVCMVAGAALNIILDPVFMYGFDMGIEGAAYATVISQAVSAVICIRYFFHMRQVSLHLSSFQPDFRMMFGNCRLGLSNCFTQLALTLMQAVMNNVLTYYGARSIYGEDIPLSCFGIIMKINTLIFAFFVGISQGSQPIYSFNYGAKQYDRVKLVYKEAIKTAVLISVVAFLAFELFPRQILGIFGTGNELYFQFGIRYLRIFEMMVIINSIQLLSSNFFAAIAMPWKGTILALCRQTFFLLPLAMILPIFFGVEGIMFASPVSDVISAVISLLVVRREFKVMGNREPKLS